MRIEIKLEDDNLRANLGEFLYDLERMYREALTTGTVTHGNIQRELNKFIVRRSFRDCDGGRLELEAVISLTKGELK